jgi:hypothetical protein
MLESQTRALLALGHQSPGSRRPIGASAARVGVFRPAARAALWNVQLALEMITWQQSCRSGTYELFWARELFWRMRAVCQVDPGNMRVGQERERGRASSQRRHGCAKTTPRIRRAIQASDEKNTVLARHYDVHRQTIAKWKARDTPFDARMGPKNPRSSILTLNGEAIVLAYRWRTRLSLDDSHVRLKRFYPHLSRSALYRCLKRHGLSRIGRTAKCSPLTSAALKGPYCFEITVNQVGGPGDAFGGAVPLFLAVEEVTKHVFARVGKVTPERAAAFLALLVAEFPQRINMVTTGITPVFTDSGATSGGNLAAVGQHPFAVACRASRIVHTRTIPPFQKPSELKRRSRAVEIR